MRAGEDRWAQRGGRSRVSVGSLFEPQGPVWRRRPLQSAPDSAVRLGLPGEPGMPGEVSPSNSSPTPPSGSVNPTVDHPPGVDLRSLTSGRHRPHLLHGVRCGVKHMVFNMANEDFSQVHRTGPRHFVEKLWLSPLLRAMNTTGNHGGGECSAVIPESVSLVQFQV